MPKDRTCADLDVPAAVEAFARPPHGSCSVTAPPAANGPGLRSPPYRLESTANVEGHILTIEDSIKYIDPRRGAWWRRARDPHRDARSFAGALRAVLREDPDVVLIGEMRDLETIEAALRIAETGHLTFSHLPRGSAVRRSRVIDILPRTSSHRCGHSFPSCSKGLHASRSARAVRGGAWRMGILVPTVAIRNLIREDKIHQIYSTMQTGRGRGGNADPQPVPGAAVQREPLRWMRRWASARGRRNSRTC